MGAYRDQQLFAELDAQQSGYRSGRDEAERRLATSIARDLGVEREVILDLSAKDLVLKARRLREIFEALPSILATTESRVEALQTGIAADVAEDIIVDQLPEQPSQNKMYYGSSDYRLTLKDDEAHVLSGAWGGFGMGPSWSFDSQEPLSAHWVRARLNALGVEREPDFCGDVVDEITDILRGDKE